MSLADVNSCENCLNLQIKNDIFEEEIIRLKAELKRYKKQAADGYFGSSTPSSKVPIKPATDKKERKPRGRKKGHKGSGREKFIDDFVKFCTIELNRPTCPHCNCTLEHKGYKERSVLEATETKTEKIKYSLGYGYCTCCQKSYKAKLSGVLPKSLYGNQLIANIVTMHYEHGIPIKRICVQYKLKPGSVINILHLAARLFEKAYGKFSEIFRDMPVKHADETGWRTDGKNGYAWFFGNNLMSIFNFGRNRSAEVPKEIFGEEEIPGVLVVDRYNGYNKLKVKIQYCYAHLLRDTEDIEKRHPESDEVKRFVATLVPLLALAMKLRNQKITDKKFYIEARKLKEKIIATVSSPSKHPGIKKIQRIFLNNENRLYHWIENRCVPAENNLAERDLRPCVIARKVSFGSASAHGAKTRSILTSIVSTLKKQGYEPVEHLKNVLDEVSVKSDFDIFSLLFPSFNYG